MPASTKRKSTTSALITKPVHHMPLRPSIRPPWTRMLCGERIPGLVQKRQLAFRARDAAGGEADEPAQAAREMRLVEVAGFGGDIARRQAFAQQQRGASRAVDLRERGAAHSRGVQEVALRGALVHGGVITRQ